LTVLDFGDLGEKVRNNELNMDLLKKEMFRKSLSKFFIFPISGALREQAPWELGSSPSPILARVSPGIVSTILGSLLSRYILYLI
jgi:hypothetical protein